LDALAINGIYVATGIPGGDRPITIEAGMLLQQLVLKNQVFLGSVNASIHHYGMAVDDLHACLQKWPAQIKAVITEKIPYQQFDRALHQHSADEIKVVVDWIP
jgi:threonine dehydrogenase-like Zn-dependent dehydrogenase